MKKIGIITVYETENTGSVLQATALKNVVEAMGYSVFFISTKNRYSAHSGKRLVKRMIRAVIRRGCVRDCWKSYWYYEHYIRDTFPTVMPEKAAWEGPEKIIIGSDTVWDVEAKYFARSHRIFWALDWRNPQIITYAATIGNSSYDTLDGLKYPKAALGQYRSVSVRDRYTGEYVRAKTGQMPQIVCDPTLLLPVEYYLEKCFPVEEKYLLLYLFDELKEEVRREIRSFAAAKGLKVVCVGKHILGSDQWIAGTVENFLSYFSSAEYIVTNTFHGTIFSILFNKAFVSLDYNKNKIAELLQSVGLPERLVSAPVSAVLEEKTDYGAVNMRIRKMREESMRFLEREL